MGKVKKMSEGTDEKSSMEEGRKSLMGNGEFDKPSQSATGEAAADEDSELAPLAGGAASSGGQPGQTPDKGRTTTMTLASSRSKQSGSSGGKKSVTRMSQAVPRGST